MQKKTSEINRSKRVSSDIENRIFWVFLMLWGVAGSQFKKPLMLVVVMNWHLDVLVGYILYQLQLLLGLSILAVRNVKNLGY